MNKVALLALFLLAVVIIGLFLELNYKKKNASKIIVAPTECVLIRGKEFGDPDNIVIYNSTTCTPAEALGKIAKTKRARYKDVGIHKHMAKKISKPFDDSYKELKEGYAEASPMSFMYKTAVGIVDVAHEITTVGNTETPYRMLLPADSKHVAFFDDGNIYIK